MIQVRSGKHDMRCSHPNGLLQIRPTSDAPPPVAPRLPCLIVPSPIRQTAHSGAMRPAAALAHAASTREANTPAELTPMSRIQAAQLSPDRHDRLDVAHWGSKLLTDIVSERLKLGLARAAPASDANTVRVSDDGGELLASHLLGSPTCRRNSGCNIAGAFRASWRDLVAPGWRAPVLWERNLGGYWRCVRPLQVDRS
jgi:hypothetical protein